MSTRSRRPAASTPTELNEAIAAHRDLFQRRYGAGAGVRLFFAPGRVNLMGAHLDYNGGPVMPTAIDRGTFLAIRPRSDSRLRLLSTVDGVAGEYDLNHLPTEALGAWSDYPLGVLHQLSGQAGARTGADCLFGGNLPIGAGLSSSASICVATGFAFDAIWQRRLAPLQLARMALVAEREFVGVKCGIMDPYAVTLTRPGHLLWLDCKDESFDHLPLDPERVTIAVADTGVRRELAQGAFNERVEQCAQAFEELRRYVPGASHLRDVPLEILDERAASLDPVLERRARHVLSEVRRTQVARHALERGDMDEFGAQMTAAHHSLRTLFEVSIPELDCLVEAACEWEGMLGTRLTGAGFGGCVVILLRTESREGFESHVQRRFAEAFGRRPSMEFFRGASGPREVGKSPPATGSGTPG